MPKTRLAGRRPAAHRRRRAAPAGPSCPSNPSCRSSPSCRSRPRRWRGCAAGPCANPSPSVRAHRDRTHRRGSHRRRADARVHRLPELPREGDGEVPLHARLALTPANPRPEAGSEAPPSAPRRAAPPARPPFARSEPGSPAGIRFTFSYVPVALVSCCHAPDAFEKRLRERFLAFAVRVVEQRDLEGLRRPVRLERQPPRRGRVVRAGLHASWLCRGSCVPPGGSPAQPSPSASGVGATTRSPSSSARRTSRSQSRSAVRELSAVRFAAAGLGPLVRLASPRSQLLLPWRVFREGGRDRNGREPRPLCPWLLSFGMRS